MASTIKVNNIQNQCGANIANKCGSTITLGASGDTITLACGASQTGFGRTGTVDWDTTAKTASFTAVSGNGYFVNTTSGAVTMTLPASPSAGDIVAVADYANTFGTNNLTIARNSQPINGGTSDYTSSTNGISLTFVYVDGTRGWKNVNDGTTNATGTPPFIVATGGTITTCGDYKIHTFTGPGTFCVSATACASLNTVDYLVVAGGGGSGLNVNVGGGGGGGGFRYYANTTNNPQACAPGSPLNNYPSGTAVTVTSQGYPIQVGAGGTTAACAPQPPGNDARAPNSVFATITSTGGGSGGLNTCVQAKPGNSGGSGGGATGGGTNTPGGTGNTPPVSPSQGNDGGTSPTFGGDNNGGGGGGAIGSGANASSPGCNPNGGGNGGAGAGVKGFGASGEVSSCVSYFSGGGGGGSQFASGGSTGGIGGAGDGNPSGFPTVGTNGTDNTGGGAGGGYAVSPTGGQSGGSGIVIIRYKYQ